MPHFHQPSRLVAARAFRRQLLRRLVDDLARQSRHFWPLPKRLLRRFVQRFLKHYATGRGTIDGWLRSGSKLGAMCALLLAILGEAHGGEVDTTPPDSPIFTGITADTGASASDQITQDNTLVLTGTAEADSIVTVTRVGLGVIGTTAADGAGIWSFDYRWVTLAASSYSFTATATDGEGNVSADSLTFSVTVDRPPSYTYTAATGAANPLNGVDVGNYSAPKFADIDSDGDLDAFIGAVDGTISFYRNTGSATNPTFILVAGAGNPFDGVEVGTYASPVFVDLDGDGDLDAVVGARDGTLHFFLNTGTASNPIFTEQNGVSNPFNGVDVGNYAAPAFADIDGDGDLDAAIGTSEGAIHFFRNTGDRLAPAFTEVTGVDNPFGNLGLDGFLNPTFMDIDADGDMDLFVGTGSVHFFRNTGTATAGAFTEITGVSSPFFSVGTGAYPTPTFADIDGDGDPDLFVGQSDGLIRFWRAVATSPSPPSVPDLSAASDSGSSSTDNNTNVTTPTFIGTAEDGSTVKLYDGTTLVGSGVATGGNYSITTSVLGTGSHSIAATATDLAGNISALSSALSVTIDTTAPTISVGNPNRTATRTGPVTYTVTYGSGATSTLAPGNITLNATGTATGTIAVTGSGLTRTVTISSITGNGTLGISLAAGTAADLAGNLVSAAGPATTFIVDNTAPTISVSAPSLSATTGGPVTYTVTYADANFNTSTLGTGSITLNKTGTADGTRAVSGTGATRTVTISGITGDGTLGISIAASTATDTAGNNAPASGASTTFVVDNTAPTVSISAPSVSATSGGPVTYTVTYSDANLASSTLSAGNITLNATGNATGSVDVTGSGATRTVTISSITGDGTLGISVEANTATDTTGHNAPAAGPSSTFVVDNTNDAPTIAGTVAGQAVNDNATLSPFSGVTIGDPDLPAQTLAVTVALDTAAKGAFSTLNGFADAGGGAYTFSGNAAAATTAIRGLVFNPADDRVAPGATETTTFTITVNDGQAGPVADSTTTVVSTSINDNPVAGGDAVQRRPGSTVKVAITQLLSNDTDPEHGTLTLSLPANLSLNGATVTIEGRWVVYSSPVSDAADSFSYTVSDGSGGTATGTVNVTVQTDTSQSKNILGIVADGSDWVLTFAGIAGLQYTIQYTENLGAPVWNTLASQAADANGRVVYRDVNPPAPARYYRTLAPAN